MSSIVLPDMMERPIIFKDDNDNNDIDDDDDVDDYSFHNENNNQKQSANKCATQKCKSVDDNDASLDILTKPSKILTSNKLEKNRQAKTPLNVPSTTYSLKNYNSNEYNNSITGSGNVELPVNKAQRSKSNDTSQNNSSQRNNTNENTNKSDNKTQNASSNSKANCEVIEKHHSLQTQSKSDSKTNQQTKLPPTNKPVCKFK